MKKGGDKNPRAPYQLFGGHDGGWKQQGTSNSSSQSWNQSHPHPHGVQQQQFVYRNNQQQQQRRPQHPVGWAAIEEINQKLKNNDLLEGSNDLLAKMDTDAVRLRMDELWPDPEKQQVFLRLIVLTGGAIHEGVQHMTQAFLRRALQSKIVDNLVNKHIVNLRPRESATIIASLAELLLLGWTTFPSLMAEKLAQQTNLLILTVKDQRSATFPSAQLDELLTRLDIVRKSVLGRQQSASINGVVERGGGRNRHNYNESSGPPPEDFRTLEILLSEDDILARNEAVYLRKAIVHGPYQSDEHYLDVQFRLLREDLCRPLRAGIRDYRANLNNNAIHNRNNSRNSLLVYTDVQFVGIELNNQDGKMLAYLRLSQRDQRRRMHRRFIFGSLICLSADGFTDSFIFGTIVDRDGIVGLARAQLQQQYNDQYQFGIEKCGTIGILLQSDIVAAQLHQGVNYWLVESPAYYECYSHVLRALQSIRVGQPVPFSNYLVQMHPDPELPRYQRDAPPLSRYQQYNNQQDQQPQPYEALPLNFRSLLVNRAHGQDADFMMRCSSTELTEEFTADQFGMDESQFEAFAYALRSEVAVIQGPPGTGKTYLGLKVVRLLFDNRRLWTTTPEGEEKEIFDWSEEDWSQHQRCLRRMNPKELEGQRPMLIVCYTNHALDQFLEGIHTFLKDGIVRVGGRSKNEALEKFNLRNLQNDDRSSYVPYGHRQHCWECRNELTELAKRMRQVKKELMTTKQEPGQIVSYKLLFPEVEEDNFEDEHPFDAILKQRYQRFFDNNHDDYTAWLSMAISTGSTTQRFEIYFNAWQLVHYYNMTEELANLAYLYCMSTDDFEVLNALYEPNFHLYWLQRLQELLQESGREQEFRAKVSEWPTLAEVDALLQIGMDPQVAVELLSSIKRDDNYENNVFQIQQYHLRGLQQQNVPPPVPMPAAFEFGEDFQAMGLEENEDEDDDDYVDPENEARMFDEAGDGDLLPGNDQLDESELPDAEQNPNQLHFQNSTNLRKYLAMISTPMSGQECVQMARAAYITPWGLPLLTRWRLYKRWVQLWEPIGQRAHTKLIREYCAKRNELDELRSVTDVELMRRAKVVGMTTTSAARLQSALRSVKPRIVVVEEAAEVFEQHILTSLTKCCEHLILIGDHQQLRPNPADFQLGKQYNLEISMFERLVMNGFEYKQLSTQHRMRPEISATMMGHFYANLQDHSSVRDYPNVLGLQKNLYFFTHSVPETSNQDEEKSHANKFEAEFAVHLAKYLHKQGYDGSQITILCTYTDQFFDIRKKLDKSFGGKRSHGIRVANVDNYQGEECDIIILSLVRSNNPENRIGFLNTANRVCVAMSRAKHGFYIFGNMDFLAKNCTTKRPSSSSNGPQTNIWAGIRQSLFDTGSIGTALPIVCQAHGNAQEITSPDQFDQLSPEGGCMQPCGVRMHCGHTCRKPCHPFDPEHTQMECMEKCGRRCPNDLHDCPRWCSQECDLCSELVERQLPCDHTRMARCHLKLEELECKEPCGLTLPRCGHPCANKCSQECTQKCAVPMERTLPCGHTIMLECHKDPIEHKCQEKVQKRWPLCGHQSSTKCCNDPAELPCPEPCGKPLADCEHPCTGTCGQCRQGRLHQDCAQDCQRILICGHPCPFKCAKVCPPCSRNCETACPHNKCNKTGKFAKKQGRTCGDPCPPCAQNCANQCAHQSCTKKCSEPCDVEPCVQPCNKPLPCSIDGPKPAKGSDNSFLLVHPCIGVCGEPCIDICAICEPDKLAEKVIWLFGTEEDEGARFVQLQECKHIFESTGLHKEIQGQLKGRDEGDAAAIVVIKCPICTIPIRRSNRYIKELNERAMQIDKVKKKLLGDKTKAELLDEWEQLKAQLKERKLEMNTVTYSEEQRVVEAFEKVREKILNAKNYEITGQWIVMAQNIDRLLLGFSQAAKRISDSYASLDATIMMTYTQFPRIHYAINSTIHIPLHHLQRYLIQDLCELLESLASRKVRNLADSTLVQMSSELGRHNLLISIFTLVGSREKRNLDIDAKGEQMLTNLLASLQTSQAFSEQKEILERMLDDFVRHFGVGAAPVSKKEMVRIQRALNSDVSKWYTCPKGHVYGIGNCGRAMQQSQCIECKETVGGSGHQLMPTNAEAREFNNRGSHLRRAKANPIFPPQY